MIKSCLSRSWGQGSREQATVKAHGEVIKGQARAESLEQLRALQSGMKIKVAITENIHVGIDTIEDLEHFKRLVEV